MKHEEASEALWELYDDELAPGKRSELDSHLAGCPECRQTLEDWRGVARAIFAPPQAPTPFQTEAFVHKVMGRIEPARQQTPASLMARLLSPRWLVPALAGIAAASLLTVPGLRGVPDPAETMILEQKGGRSFWSFAEDSAPSSRDEVLAFVQGAR